jgi:hypothetical protein
MKKVLFFMLFLMIPGTAFVNAQVRIGGNAPPEKGAVLDLKSSASAPGYVGGLLLPRVEITAENAVPASWVGSGTLDESKLKGLLVFIDNNTVVPKGIYVWNGTKWKAVITI